jgi:hypothetical protein
MPTVGQRDGNWMWDGTNWVCSPDCGSDAGCPPFGPPVFSGPVSQPPWYPGANGGVSFGTVAPPNPVRGHLWWDGKVFWLFDGAAWVPFGGTQTAPSMGVTDGSNAPAGQVGEYLIGQTTMAYAAYPAETTQALTPLTLPAGDWDIAVSMLASTYVGGMEFYLSPSVPGVSNGLEAFNFVQGITSGADQSISLLGVARGSFSVPSLLGFIGIVYQSGYTGLTGGTAYLRAEARRAR